MFGWTVSRKPGLTRTMPDDPISFSEADARFATKEALVSLGAAIRDSETRIMDAIRGLQKTMDTRHEDENRRYDSLENRVRLTEASGVAIQIRVSALEKPSSLSTMGNNIVTGLLTGLASAAGFGALAYFTVAHVAAK